METIEATQLQVGEDSKEINLVASTVPELEMLKEYLIAEHTRNGRSSNILLGFPLPPSDIPRLARLGRSLGEKSISIMIDHEDQLLQLSRFREIAGFAPLVYLKIDTGYHRAGILPREDALLPLFEKLNAVTFKEHAILHGLYSHAGHSYAGVSPEEAMAYLGQEITGLQTAVDVLSKAYGQDNIPPLTLSVGATPSATAIQNLGQHSPTSEEEKSLLEAISLIRTSYPSCPLELHAGVYTFLDLQQLHTRATPSIEASRGGSDGMPTSELALTVLAEIASVYPSRSPPEALIAAGTLALGREPCPGYSGWGIVSNWTLGGDVTSSSGWEVFKISQEHGLIRKGDGVDGIGGTGHSGGGHETPWKIGQKVRIWPNHACVAGAMYSFYVVVDRDIDSGNKVVDVWHRCRGW